MVSVGKDSKFIKYELIEVVTKLNSLISSEEKVRLWKKDCLPFFCTLIDINKKKLLLSFNTIPEYALKNNDTVLINFSFNDLDFFMKADISQIENSEIELSVENVVYKTERRGNERLLTYPHMETYAYLSFENNKQLNTTQTSNILSFTKVDTKEKGHLKKFLSSSRAAEFPEEWLSDDIEDEVKLQGYRVMDISCVGLSFCVNLEEERTLFSTSMDQTWEIYLLFDNIAFTLTEAKVVYSIDFVNPQSTVIPMKKIGMNFDAPQELVKKIYSYIDDLSVTSELEKDFEHLIFTKKS